MARAVVPKDQKAIPAHISLPAPLIAKTRKIACNQGKSLSGFMRELLMAHLAALEEAAQ
jgi:hypothetical protein